MATAKIKERKPKPRKVKVTLELSGKEARALHAVLGCGVIGTGPRKHTSAIFWALRGAGISSETEDRLLSGQVSFREYPTPDKAE